MSLARWDPFLQPNNLENEVKRRRQFSAQEQFGEALRRAEFAPPVHSYEDENRVTLKMEVSGIDTKDLDIRVDANTVT
jgi:HSP20 family protein